MSTLTELAERALQHARALDEFSQTRGLPPTHFFYDTLTDLPPALEDHRKALIDVGQDLKRLSLGAVGMMLETLFTFTDLQALRFLYRHNVPKFVPVDGERSFAEIARDAGLDEGILRRFLQQAMVSRLFAECRPGFVRHTAASRLLCTETKAMDTVGFLLEDLAPAALNVQEAHERWPGSQEPNETGFNVVNSTSKPFYLELAEDPERSRRFGAGMNFMTQGSLYSLEHLVEVFDWSALDRAAASVIDIGGGHGSVSIFLATRFHNVKFIVQDLPGTVKEGRELLSPDLESRVTFMAHDFFSEQPVRGADVFFFRFILHNWSDKYATQILRQLIPALKSGSRIIIYEFLPAEVANVRWSEKQARNLDMIQALGWNSLERTTKDWAALFEKTDPRFKFIGTRSSAGSAVSLIEAIWVGSASEK